MLDEVNLANLALASLDPWSFPGIFFFPTLLTFSVLQLRLQREVGDERARSRGALRERLQVRLHAPGQGCHRLHQEWGHHERGAAVPDFPGSHQSRACHGSHRDVHQPTYPFRVPGEKSRVWRGFGVTSLYWMFIARVSPWRGVKSQNIVSKLHLRCCSWLKLLTSLGVLRCGMRSWEVNPEISSFFAILTPFQVAVLNTVPTADQWPSRVQEQPQGHPDTFPVLYWGEVTGRAGCHHRKERHQDYHLEP